MPRQRPQIPAQNDALACADSIELLDPSRVGMIACHLVLKALGADRRKLLEFLSCPDSWLIGPRMSHQIGVTSFTS